MVDSSIMKEVQNREDVRKKKAESQKRAMSNPEIRKKISEATKIAMNKPEIREKFLRAIENPDRKRKIKESLNNLENRSKRIQSLKISLSDPEVKRRTSEQSKEYHNRPEVKRRTSEQSKEYHNRDEIRTKISLWSKEHFNRPEVKRRISETSKIYHNKPEVKEMNRTRMLNGHAVYMLQFLKNPSKPQVALFKLLQQLCPNPILNYPIYYRKKWNYSIDIADPRLGLAFEYDEPYWHKHKGKDLRRQKRIEELGWKFLRYEKLPALEQLKNDINRVMEPIYEYKNKKEKSFY